jgi:hypothetical protein
MLPVPMSRYACSMGTNQESLTALSGLRSSSFGGQCSTRYLGSRRRCETAPSLLCSIALLLGSGPPVKNKTCDAQHATLSTKHTVHRTLHTAYCTMHSYTARPLQRFNQRAVWTAELTASRVSPVLSITVALTSTSPDILYIC